MHWKPTYCRNVCGMAGIRRWRCARQMQSRSQTRPEIENWTSRKRRAASTAWWRWRWLKRSEEHTSDIQALMRNSYDVFCLKKNTAASKIVTRDKKNTKDNTKKTE